MELAGLIRQRVMYSIGQHRALPVSQTLAEEVVLLKELATGAGATDAEAWQEQLRLVFELLLHASGARQHCTGIICFLQAALLLVVSYESKHKQQAWI